MKRYISCGLSLPMELMQKIDIDQKDVSRSRFLLRLLERVYEVDAKEEKTNNWLNPNHWSLIYFTLLEKEIRGQGGKEFWTETN